MEQAVGANAQILYGFGATTSALPGSPAGLVLHYKGGESFNASADETASDVMSNNPNPTESMDGATKVNGGFSTDLAWQLALLLKQHFGSCSGSVAGAVKAFKGALSTGYDAVLEATTAGVAGNLITVALTGDATPTVRISRVGNAITIAYNSGTSTVGDVNAAVAALAGADDIIGIKTAGTTGTVLTAPGDNCTATALTGGNDGIYTEVIKLAAITDYMWFEKGFPDLDTPKYFPFVGYRIAKFGYDRKATGPIAVTFDIPGCKDLAATGTSADATPVDLGHDSFNAKLGDVLVDGATVGTITSAKYDSERKASPSDPVIGSGGYSTNIPVGRGTLKGSLTSLFDSTALFDKAVSRATVALKFQDQIGTGDGSAGNESMETHFPEVHLAKKTPDIKDDTGVMLESAFTAFLKDDAGNSACIITIKHSSTVLHELLNPA